MITKSLNRGRARRAGGFTLIELLIVVTIIAILAVVVFVTLRPATRFADARNSRRWSDVANILTAIHEYIVDNDGDLPTGVSTTEQQLGTCSSGGSSVCTGAAAACLNLSTTLAVYLKSIPIDPGGGSAATTYYSVVADSNNIITVSACNAENGETIEASR
jgi:prepilin-type N-terminal cleavage/methylation domain-containing protein